MLPVIYLLIITIGVVLMLLGQDAIGGLTIWILSMSLFILGILGSSLATPITGFGAGMTIIGHIAGLRGIYHLLDSIVEKGFK